VCLALGIDDPEQWLHEATSRKLAIWEAYYKVEPWGSEWERSAMVTASVTNTVAACHGVKKKDMSDLQDYMPADWVGRKAKKTKCRQSIQGFRDFVQQRFKR